MQKPRKAHQKDKPTQSVKQEVCHTVAMPFTLKSKYLKAKEELWKLKLLHHSKNIPNLPTKNPLKETKILQDIRTL